MLTTGIFGGSFNPVHNGHIELARRLLSLTKLDEIWFVVSPQNPFKRNDHLLDDCMRLEMVRLALIGEQSMKPSDYEFSMPRPSYMWHTLQSMSRNYPDRQFVLLIGADNWARFNEWYAADKILANYRIEVYPREDAPVDAASLPAGVTLADTGLIPGSSTEVRRRIAAGEPIDGLVPPDVARFIRANNLYTRPHSRFSV